MAIESMNPATGEVIARFSELTPDAVDAAVDLGHQAFQTWRQTSFADRAAILRRTGELLRERRERYGVLMAEEMGKPLAEGESESEKCAWVCDFYAENAERFLSPESVETDARRSYVRFDPLGVVLAVMPWNFPFWQVFRFAAPALMAGNVGLLKHSSNVPRCSLAIDEVLRDAGLPAGVFQSLLIGSSMIERILQREEVRAATLTGSEDAGSSLAAIAGRLCKKVVLELGGSDPFIVLDDVDIPAVAAAAARARTINTGQSCIAAKRFLVMEKIADPFVAAFSRELQSLKVGDPQDRAIRLGPLAREDLLDDLERQVSDSVEQGAVLVTGGARLDLHGGAFYAPTLLDRVVPGMPAFDQETFGPVAAVIRVASEDEAVRLANQSRYGLGASIWSGSSERAERLASRIEAGAVFINGMVKSDPRLPFGGVKLSGHGRELAGYGIKEFVNIKTVWVG